MRRLGYLMPLVPILVPLVLARDTSLAPELAQALPNRMDSPEPRPLILAANEGEGRVRRTLGGAPLIVKIDRLNGGAPEFVMGTEEIPPGQTIPPHHHVDADEIVLIQRGTGAARVGDRVASVQAGATIYIPRHTRITLQNTGNEPLAIAFIFSKPGFEGYLRDTSVPEGQIATPLAPSELSAIRKRYQRHVVYE
jgi:quercetin dioxygenase-like cupin family protein